jgi:hypothetical protein
LKFGILGAFGFGSSGCGTLLSPERKGQPAGPLDWKIVALDAIGLIFFFVPGVIAFAVDFNNGSIYLPSNSYGATKPRRRRPLITIRVPERRLTRARIEQIVSDRTGRSVDLKSGTYQTRELENLDEFWSARDDLALQDS